MKSLAIIVFASLISTAFAGCDLELETHGFSNSQANLVKNILKSKNYRIVSRTRGDHDLSISMGSAGNCIGGLEMVWMTNGYYRIESKTLNVFAHDSKSVTRLSGDRFMMEGILRTIKGVSDCR